MKLALLALITVLSLNTCVNFFGNHSEDTLPDTLPPYSLSGKDFRSQGAFTYSITDASLKSASGCTVKYREFKPDKADHSSLVVLGHGFFRSQKTQKEMAEHFASWGIWTVTVNFCNSRPWNGHHDKNGADMILVANALNPEHVIYAGFSAGGLSAFIAASLDSRTEAYLGLDMVDNFKKGIKAAKNVKAPVFGLVGESSACNAHNNGLEAYLAYDKNDFSSSAKLLKIHGASHCDFEFPYDGKCSLACGKTRSPFEHKEVQENILGLSTSLLLDLLHQNGENWWDTENNNFKVLTAAKRVSPIEP